MRCHRIEVVLDVGANDGDFGRKIRDEGYRGRIASLEPNPAAYERLCGAIVNDPLWEAHAHTSIALDGQLPRSAMLVLA